jgi:transcriptional regulator
MYLRAGHADLHIPSLYKFIRQNPLGILTTAIPSPNHHSIQSSHIPWLLDVVDEEETETSTAKLRGHIARGNPQCKALIEAATKAGSNTLSEEVLIIFNGPAHHYITPKFYVETKPSTGKVVPTWNYSAVQVYGTVTLHFDTSLPSTDAFISKAIGDLSKQSEEQIFGFNGENGKPKAWSVDESPESYINLLKKAIIGIEIEIKDIGGKFKFSQELKDGDRKGVIEGFKELGTELGAEISRTVKEREDIMNSGSTA